METTILLVEDEALIAMDEAAVLEKNGYKVVTAYNAKKAIEKARDESIDLILMDIDLGDGKMDGTEAAEEILKYRELPIVFLTSHAEKEMVEKVKGITRYGYVLKNAGEFVLIESIGTAFELFEAHRRHKIKEESYRTLYEYTPMPYQSLDKEGKFLAVNSAWLGTLGGYTRDEVIGRSFAEFIQTDCMEDFEQKFAEFVEQGFAKDNRYRMRKKNGEYLDVSFQGRAFYSPEGEFLQTHCVFQPLSEFKEHEIRKQALSDQNEAEKKYLEDELKKSAARHTSLLEALPDMMFLLDKKGTYIDYKPDEERLLKVPRDKFLGKSIFEILPSRIAEQIHHNMKEAFRTKQIQQFEHEMVLDGVSYIFETRMAVVDEDHVVSIVRNITAQKKAEDELIQSKERYKNIFQNTLVSIWEEDFSQVYSALEQLKKEGVTDFDAYFNEKPEKVREFAGMIEVVNVNETTLDWYGAKSKEDFLGKVDVFFTEDTYPLMRKELVAIAEGKRWIEGETKGRTFQGDIKNLSIKITLPPPKEEKKIMIVALSDVTQLKKAQEKASFLMKELNHRVKNNLLMISSLINLKDASLGDSVDLSDLVHQIDAIRIIHEKLHGSEDITKIHLPNYLEDLLDTVLSFSPKHINTELRIETEYLHPRKAAPLGLIVNELAVNAMKHGFIDQENPGFTVEMKEDSSKSCYTLTVSNNGCPFPEHIDLENPSTLGLRLISALVEQIGGTMNLEREPHPVFTISFPMEKEE